MVLQEVQILQYLHGQDIRSNHFTTIYFIKKQASKACFSYYIRWLLNLKLIHYNDKKVDIFYIFISYYFTKTPKMKKNYFLTILLTLCATLAFAQVSLPHYEAFDYTAGANLSAQTNWEAYSAAGTNPIDVVSGNLTYSGFANPTGNSINMVGGSEDDRILFTEVTTGEVYVSFLLNVTDISAITDLTDGGYFAIFASSTNGFQSRLWVKPTVDTSSTTVDFAYTTGSSGSGFGQSQNLNSVVLVVMSYNVDTGAVNAWINPASGSFEAGSAPAADFTDTDSSPSAIDRLLLRQDSNGETPNMIIDELRIGTTWASVTPSGSVSMDPAITINAPSNNAVFPSTTTEVPVTLTVDNFTLSGDNGSGMTDNSGDGYIKATLDETGQPQEVTSFFTTTPTPITVVAGRSYTATVELVDNAGASLSPQVMATVSFSVELPCDLVLGAIATTCDASTAGTDTYSGTIAFTGGNTGITYTITAPAGVTVGGDDPSSMAAGTITFSNMMEGTNYDIDIVGGAGSSCDYDRTLFSPTCFSLPFTEPFDYTADTDLISHPLWQDASTSGTPNNIQVKSNDNGGAPILGNFYLSTEFPDQTGNMVSMSGGGSDPYIGFDEKTTGTVYASFMFHVTDMSGVTDPDGGYFAVLTENGSFRGRVWVKDVTAGTTNEGLQFNVGISTGSGSSGTYHTGFTANLAEPVFVVIGYDLDNNELDLWVVPDATTFGTNIPPAANVTLTDATAGGINRFVLRQDSSTETPAMDFDELRMGTTWSEVAPSGATASTGDETIEGFAAYPNPVNNKRFTITTNSISEKKVQIYNVLGRQVFTTQFTSNDKLIDISTLSNGIYILKVQEGTKIATKKLVVR